MPFSLGNNFYENCFCDVYMDKGAISKKSEGDLHQLVWLMDVILFD